VLEAGAAMGAVAKRLVGGLPAAAQRYRMTTWLEFLMAIVLGPPRLVRFPSTTLPDDGNIMGAIGRQERIVEIRCPLIGVRIIIELS